MGSRLAVDFGTSNTLFSLWEESTRSAILQDLPVFCRAYSQAGASIPVIPSLIHYAEDERKWIGSQVLDRNLHASPRTFRWMKRYIMNRSPFSLRLGTRNITPFDAASDYLKTLITFFQEEQGIAVDELGFSVPVEAFEDYENWLATLSEELHIPGCRFIDEPAAAALGYGANIQPGAVYLLFDFGGGTLHAAVVKVEEPDTRSGGRKCRILGKAGKDIGGSMIDRWLYEEVLAMNNLQDTDDDVREISNSVIIECERIKSELSEKESSALQMDFPGTNRGIHAKFLRPQLDDLLDRRGLFTEIIQTLRQAFHASRERGYDEDAVHSVLLVGGSSQIPAVQRLLRQQFGNDRVFCSQPFEAVARGTAAFIAGVDFFDHIQHDYAIRHLNSATGHHEFHTIISRGTPYPSLEPVCKLTIRPSHDNQGKMGIDIFELGQDTIHSTDSFELVLDPTGHMCIRPVSASQREERSRLWMNEDHRTFIDVDPPGIRGENRFLLEFSIDFNKRLIVTVRDQKTTKIIFKDHPVVRLN